MRFAGSVFNQNALYPGNPGDIAQLTDEQRMDRLREERMEMKLQQKDPYTEYVMPELNLPGSPEEAGPPGVSNPMDYDIKRYRERPASPTLMANNYGLDPNNIKHFYMRKFAEGSDAVQDPMPIVGPVDREGNVDKVPFRGYYPREGSPFPSLAPIL